MVSSDFSPLLCICVFVCVCVCVQSRLRFSLDVAQSPAQSRNGKACVRWSGHARLITTITSHLAPPPLPTMSDTGSKQKQKNWEIFLVLWISHRAEAAGAGSAGMASAMKPISLKALSPYEQQQALGVLPTAKPWTLPLSSLAKRRNGTTHGAPYAAQPGLKSCKKKNREAARTEGATYRAPHSCAAWAQGRAVQSGTLCSL
jgi:hypothetical protein